MVGLHDVLFYAITKYYSKYYANGSCNFFLFASNFIFLFGLKFWLYIFLNLSEAIRINTAKTLIAFTSLSLSLPGMMQKKSLVRIRRELLSVN